MILGLLLISILGFFWLPSYYKKIINRANQTLVSRIKSLYSEGINKNEDIENKLISENFNKKDIQFAILAINLEKQGITTYLAPTGGVLGSIFLLRNLIVGYTGQTLFYILYVICFIGFAYFFFRNKKTA